MSHVPTHVTNGKLIDQMKEWGWREGKANGNFVTMRPPANIDGETIKVKPRQVHNGNSSRVISDVYRLTCQGDRELFWRGPSELWVEMVARAEYEAEQRRQARETAAAERATARAANAAATAPPVPSPAPADPPRPKRRRTSDVTSKDVLAVLVKLDRPTRAVDVAADLNIDPTAANLKTLVARLGYLADKGHAVRVMNGCYRVAPTAAAMAGRYDHDVQHHGDIVPPIVVDPPAPPADVVVAEQHSTEVVVVYRATPEVDEEAELEAVLDMLLPDGYKAKHRRMVEDWVELTRKMRATVNGDR